MAGVKQKVYVETSVVSYLTARPSRDLVIAARQEITRERWPRLIGEFDPYVSIGVLEEASQGEPSMAQNRLKALQRMPILAIDESTEKLARVLVDEGAIPAEFPEDALHIAAAARNGMDYLVTWNFRHLNNARMKQLIERVLVEEGYVCPVICSLDELLGDEP